MIAHDIHGRALTDVTIDLIIGYLFCGQASSKIEMDVAAASGASTDNGDTIPMKQRKAMIARRYIEVHGGTLTFESTEDVGTTALITLPRTQDSRTEDAA